MKKRRKVEHRPKPKAKKKKPNASPWHKFKTFLPKAPAPEIIIPPVSDGDSLADEIEQLENDPDQEPDEIPEE
jgi:hypothetical protein